MHSLATTRIHNHQLQTPHVILRHPNGHSVQVIGVLHYALPTTWIAINKRLRVLSDRGWAVHYEQVRPVPNMTARERSIHRQFQQVRSILGKKLGVWAQFIKRMASTIPGARSTQTPLFAKFTQPTRDLSWGLLPASSSLASSSGSPPHRMLCGYWVANSLMRATMLLTAFSTTASCSTAAMQSRSPTALWQHRRML